MRALFNAGSNSPARPVCLGATISLGLVLEGCLGGADTVQNGTGTATLSWVPPTTRTDGSVLINLAGYRIRYGTSVDALTSVIDVSNPGLTIYVIENLSAGTYFFALTAYDSAGLESEQTYPVSKTIQ